MNESNDRRKSIKQELKRKEIMDAEFSGEETQAIVIVKI